MISLSDVVPLLAEINDGKRLRRSGWPGSLAEQGFRSAWAGLIAGEEHIPFHSTAHAVANARLGGIDRGVLQGAGLSFEEITVILQRSFDAVSAAMDPALCIQLRKELSSDLDNTEIPSFVDRLCSQPRAGATRPGRPRVVLMPPESHGDHCFTTAVYAVLLSPYFGADPDISFTAALAHHLHNAALPDGGFTGEEMLGEHLQIVVHAFREQAAAQLNPQTRAAVLDALQATASADTPEGKAFHAADVIDRVLQMKWYEQAASFRLGVALEDMELVHAGPVQAFHCQILRDAGLW